ncbi:Ribosomal RNA small subunit methyltransferase G [Burkholderiales bacterium 8X]|nr:Ribosomal RNA small subunit methyltransferase G [Burkholderiales bacterium 8X]
MSDVERLRSRGEALGLQLSELQLEQLLAFGKLILRWNKVYNLTALRDTDSVLSHHLLDSLAAMPPLARQFASAGDLLDVGSGAGLPGVVIAIMRRDLNVTCLDAVAKKVAFVQQVAAELRLENLRAVHERVEAHRGQYAVISSRAFASLADFFDGSRHLLSSEGCWMALKGKVPTDELSGLGSGIDVFHVEQLDVPGLDAARCIVWARKQEGECGAEPLA